MLKKEYERTKKSFNEYYSQYDNTKKLIALKYNHSNRVDDLMEQLAKKIGFDTESIYLAKIIGLLHDLGRFEQVKRINSFDDKKLDHAELSADYLFKEGNIRKFISTDKYDSIIEKSIRNHNKLAIEKDLSPSEKFFAKMIRDMDKVDIFYQIATNYKNEFIETPTTEVIKRFYNGESVERSSLKNNNSDRVIFFLSFINDINFNESFEILNNTKNIDFYCDSINVSDNQKDLFEKLKRELYKKIKKNKEKQLVKKDELWKN